jgi:hypothetical protein
MGVRFQLVLLDFYRRSTHMLVRIQWVLGALSLWVKKPQHEADHMPPTSTKVMDAWSRTSTPLHVFFKPMCLIKQVICLHGMVLSYKQENCTFTLPTHCTHECNILLNNEGSVNIYIYNT